MKINPNNYPYPFLSEENDNYRNAKFSAETTGVLLNEDTNNFEIELEVFLKNSKIEEMIKQGEISLQIHVDCLETYYNEIFNVTNNKMKISVEKRKIAGKVELNVLLVASQNIQNYENEDFHTDFNNLSFNFIEGNLLGGAYAGEIIIENKVPEKVEGIFKIVSHLDLVPGEIDADYTKNKIYIYLSENDHLNIQRLLTNEKNSSLLYSLIIIPVLVDALYYIKEVKNIGYDTSEIEKLDWYKSIDSRLSDIGIDLDEGEEIPNPLVTASNLIGNPLTDSLTVLLEGEEENAEY